MRLIQCHIENFGKLHDHTEEFEQGCNVFCENNGWGKSTFAAFIRVMLYGFEGENKRRGIENERKRYWPWQGGSYGGQLTFEANGGRYTVTRIFSEKKQNDIFELRDADTNLESTDFTENLGEELFQINSESFMRTVFIGQNDCITRSTDSINAKIGNLTDNMNDLDCYEKAYGALQNLLNKMNPRRKTGTIYQMKDRITHMQTAVASGESIEESIQKYNVLILHENETLQQKKAEQTKIYALQKKVSLLQDVKAKRSAYEQLCVDFAEKERLKKETAAMFPGGMPEETELQEYLNACSDMEQAGHAAGIYRLTDQEEEQFEALSRKYQNGITNLKSPDHDGEDESVDEVSGLIGLWNERNTRKSVHFMKEAALQTMEAAAQAEKKNTTGRKPILSILGIAVAILGVVLCIRMMIPGLVLIAAGAVLVIAYLAGGRRSCDVQRALGRSDSVDQGTRRRGGFGDQGTQENDALKNLEKEICEDETFIRNTDQKVSLFLNRYGYAFDEADAGDKLQKILAEIIQQAQELQNNVQRYNRLKEKNLNYQISCEKYEWNRQFVMAGIRKMGLIPADNLKEQLQSIWRNRIICINGQKEYDTAKAKKQDFEVRNDMEKILAAVPDTELPGLEELNRQQTRLDEEIESIRSKLHIYHVQMESLREKYDDWTETKERLSAAKEEAASQKIKYRQLQKAQEYLTKAKESLTARYMEPLMKCFSGYYQIVLGETEGSRVRGDRAENVNDKAEAAACGAVIPADQYRMDANINITVEEQGLQRETHYLSTGYQDLIGLCMRFSLVDAMYRGEKPFLILDDPFVNLDDEKIIGGRKLLESIAKEYQVIYFTCTSGRG